MIHICFPKYKTMKKSKVKLITLSMKKDRISSPHPHELQQLQGGLENSSATIRYPFTMNHTRGLFWDATKVPFSIRFLCVAADGVE